MDEQCCSEMDPCDIVLVKTFDSKSAILGILSNAPDINLSEQPAQKEFPVHLSLRLVIFVNHDSL